MLSHSINPVLFSIGGLQVNYYLLVYLLGFVFLFYVFVRGRRELGITKGQACGIVGFGFLAAIVGARIFNILFWNFDYFVANPEKIWYVWEGGLAFHGGLLGAVVFLWIYTKMKGINAAKIADVLGLYALVFIPIFGRIANFTNQEIVGTVASVPWCFNFAYSEGCRHPVQLYAAFGRAVFFFVLLRMKNYKEGFLFWISLTGLALGRFFLDFVREGDLYFGLLMGQWFSLLIILIGISVFRKYYREDVRKVYNKFFSR